jgi:predicted HNH restriction endonuclease
MLTSNLKKKKRVLTERELEYQKYLRSKKWRDFREKLIKKRGRNCAACGIYKKRIEAHHITYERFTRERESDIVLLCHSCHKLVTRMYLRNKRQDLPLVTKRVIEHMQSLILLKALDN